MIPPAVFMFVTKACNLSCRHCYVSASPEQTERMALSVFERVVSVFQSAGVSDFRLTGGEPTIHPDFPRMLEVLNEGGSRPRLITNGIKLLKSPNPGNVLERVSFAWISAYGISAEQHQKTGGRNAPRLDQIFDFVGRQGDLGLGVGVSVLLTQVDLLSLDALLRTAADFGVRHLRFIFGERLGRAEVTLAGFAHGADGRGQGALIARHLQAAARELPFETLSINDPFDLASATGLPGASCLLHERKMWSVAPDGRVYSCCFNIYDPRHFVTDQLLALGMSALPDQSAMYASRCRALSADFWGSEALPTCPISSYQLNDMQSELVGA